ncbi:MAG: tRNA dihydrouridine synthase DusB, partial [Flavipsychrobacter sp.]|nr:tRNA dihydrouridine synthase DusB [Flavipsychrobacter sp.]
FVVMSVSAAKVMSNTIYLSTINEPLVKIFISGDFGCIYSAYIRNFAPQMAKIGQIELGEFPLLLAPMEDVSDPPFRAVCKQHGADLMYTEFISSEGLIRDAIKSRQKLDIFDYERPIGIQIFGGDEEAMAMQRRRSRGIEGYRPDGAPYKSSGSVYQTAGYGQNAAGLGR